MEFRKKDFYTMDDMLQVMEMLRDPVTGCEWDSIQTHESIRQNFIEETYEAVDAIDKKDTELLQEELGDVLFSVVNLSLFYKVDSELALLACCKKFRQRFEYVEGQVNAQGGDWSSFSLDQLDAYWNEAKNTITD